MSRSLTLVATTSLITLFIGFVVFHLLAPSDGARLQPGTEAWAADGVVLTPLRGTDGALQAGDVVVTVEGIPLETWVADLLARELPRPDWQVGGTAAYEARRAGSGVTLDQPLDRYPLLAVFRADWGAFSFALANFLVAAFAFTRRPEDLAVRVLLLAAASMLAASTWSIGLQVSDIVGGAGFILYQVTTIAAFSLVWACLLHFVLIFPRPQPWLAKRRWVIPALYIIPIVVNGLWVVLSRPVSPSVLAWFSGLGRATSVLQLVYSLLIVVAAIMAVRYARDPVSRAQVRWVLFAMVLAITFGLVMALIPELLTGKPFVSMNVVAVFGLILPISMVIAIFRVHLFNIDLIIRRTTQYAIVTLLLALVYLGSVVVLQRLFTEVTGQSSTVAIVLSTLLIAALFLPLRRRVQDSIDRRFYRQKYDAEKVLNQFAATVRDETDLDALTAELVRVIQETMQPEFVSVWLRPNEDPPAISRGTAGKSQEAVQRSHD